MKAALPLLALLVLSPLQAQNADAGSLIRDGRSALEAGRPVQARQLFSEALAQSADKPANAYAAAIGLGRAELWLGDYRAGEQAFRRASRLAANPAEHRLAATGLAQALNAQDYPRQAWSLVAPLAADDPQATLELMRAARSTGRQIRTLPALTATQAPGGSGYLATQFQLLADDMRYATSPQLEGDFGYSHDNEGLDTWSVGGAWLSSASTHGSTSQRWGVALDTTSVNDGQRTRHLQQAAWLGKWQAGDSHSIDVRLGAGRSSGWQYLQGDAHWTFQPNDSFALSASAERAPLLTDTAIERRITYDTYSAGTRLRAAGHVYVLPTVYRQSFSDGNRRNGGSLRLLLSPWDITGTPTALGAQISARAFRSSQPGGGVYFNPRSYRSAQVGLIGVYSLSPLWKLRATADTGRQTIDGRGADIYTIDLSLEGRLPHNGRLQLHAGRSSAASVNNGGAGYWNNTMSVSVSYPF